MRNRSFFPIYLVLLFLPLNELIAQKSFSFSVHYGPVAPFLSNKEGTEPAFESVFKSRHHSFLRLDLSAHRLMLRLCYASLKISY